MYTPGRAVVVTHRIATLVVAVTLFFALFTLVSIAVGIARDGRSLNYASGIDVPVDLPSDPSNHGLPPQVHFAGEPNVSLEIEKPTTEEMLLRSLEDVLALGGFLVAAWLVRAFLRSVLDGEPFGARNARRLRALGGLLLVGAPLFVLAEVVIRKALVDLASSHAGLTAKGFAFPRGATLAGLGAYVLAEVFAYGARLREDVEGTV